MGPFYRIKTNCPFIEIAETKENRAKITKFEWSFRAASQYFLINANLFTRFKRV